MLSRDEFINRNIEAWRKLEEYNKKLEKKSVSKLSRLEIREYAGLLRSASHHLSLARTYYAGDRCVEYLNRLTGSAATRFFVGEKTKITDFTRYFTETFPRLVRKYFKYCAAAFAFFTLGALFAVLLTRIDPAYLSYFVPRDLIENNNLGGDPLSADASAYFFESSYIMTNNIYVCALAIVYGLFAGCGTLWVLLQNGAVLGGIYAMVKIYNLDEVRFWSLILPHGFTELFAIFVSGGAGLLIGKSLLIPGNLTRGGSLVKGAKEAFLFVPGVAVMLVIAGLIEGFFTPLAVAEDWLKIAFSAVTAVLLAVYFGFCGRKNRD
ncbi:MAG: stage II sporulation protein M [Clostridiales bacterium]|jgi:uncharacterized membrane protein SpoIIM required for sporulation|nr:stage II sporulation protein M [Clostridiales bacterium]